LIAGNAAVPHAGGNSYGRGFTWSADTGSVLLPTLNGEGSGTVDVNNAGFIAGYIGGGGASVKAARWNPDGSFNILYAPVGFALTTAINSSNEIVGTAMLNGPQAVMWSGDGEFTSLNSLLTQEQLVHWNLVQAFDINDHGQIVGYGRYDPDGAAGPLRDWNEAFLLNRRPNPEPNCCAVLFLACAMVRVRRRVGIAASFN
jgi:hypothetical protein